MATKLATTLLLCSLSLLSTPAAAQESINVGFGNPNKATERPGGAGATTATKDFRWKDPFTASSLADSASGLLLKPSCHATRSFKAHQFLLDDLKESPPLGLGPYADRLKTFFQGREYPGSWDGLDPHGYDRNVVLMEWDDVPAPVRGWIDEQARQKTETKQDKDMTEEEKKERKKKEDLSGKGLFAVYRKARAPKDHKVIIFAPGAIYETLPLWVAEGSDCQKTLLDLSKYTPEVADGAVIGWVTEHTSPDREKKEREIQFTIRVESLKLAEAVPENSGSNDKDEL